MELKFSQKLRNIIKVEINADIKEDLSNKKLTSRKKVIKSSSSSDRSIIFFSEVVV